MAHRATTWVWNTKLGGDTSAKLVLLSLADHANFELTCFPSIKLISKETELSNSTVVRALQRLEKLDLISRQRHWRKSRTGGRTVNSYVLHVRDSGLSVTVTPKQGGLSVNDDRLSVNGDTYKSNALNRHLEPKRKDSVFVEEGTADWEAWVSYLGKRPPMKNFGWFFPSRRPPECADRNQGGI